MLEPYESVQIRIRQLQLYGGHFQMHLFKLCPIDYTFLLTVFLFVFNYALIIIQTNQ